MRPAKVICDKNFSRHTSTARGGAHNRVDGDVVRSGLLIFGFESRARPDSEERAHRQQSRRHDWQAHALEPTRPAAEDSTRNGLGTGSDPSDLKARLQSRHVCRHRHRVCLVRRERGCGSGRRGAMTAHRDRSPVSGWIRYVCSSSPLPVSPTLHSYQIDYHPKL